MNKNIYNFLSVFSHIDLYGISCGKFYNKRNTYVSFLFHLFLFFILEISFGRVMNDNRSLQIIILI